MRFFPYRFNGFLFQQNNRVASELDDYDWDIGGIQTLNAQRANKRPKYSGVVYNGDVKIVHVVLNSPDRDRDALITALDVSGERQRELYATDELGRTWFLMAKCAGVNVEENDGKTVKLGCIFEVDDPTWALVEESVDEWEVLSNGQTHTINVPGNQPTFPIFEMMGGTPPAEKYPGVRFIKCYNPIAYAQTDGIDITGGGWDTAALVTAGKMKASGADVRVFFDGAMIPFWVGGGGWNNSATRLFILASWQPGQQMPLRTALNDSTTPALIEWTVTDAVKSALSKLPRNGILLVGEEEISYKNLRANECDAEIVERAIRGTSMAAHAVNDICWWVEHDIRIIYGNPAASAPTYDNSKKPIFNLTTSTNTSRVFEIFTVLSNPLSWYPTTINKGVGKGCRIYTSPQGGQDVPATELGLSIENYSVSGLVKPDTGDLTWGLYHPAGVTTVTTAGVKNKAFSDTWWPEVASLESSENGLVWRTEWNETAPSGAPTPESISNTSAETMESNSRYIRYRLAGNINALENNFARLEIQTVTVVLSSANIIQVTLRDEQVNYQLSIQIRNNTTGESLYVEYPMQEDQTFVIDSEAMTAIYRGMNAIRALGWDTIRTDWLRLEPGENELQIFVDPPGGLDIMTTFRARAL